MLRSIFAPFQTYAQYKESQKIHAVITNPETPAAKRAINSVKRDLDAAKAAYDEKVARMQKYNNAVNLIEDGKRIDGYLKIFSAIEASSPSSVGVDVDSQQEIKKQLHKKPLSKLDESILTKKDPITKKTLREEFNEFLKSRSPVEEQAVDEAVQQEQDPLIKKIKNSLPTDKNKREVVEEFTDKVAELEAACFGFAARYRLFEEGRAYDPSASTHKHLKNKQTQLESYTLISFYEEAVCFLRKISPHYYNREFHIVPAKVGKEEHTITSTAKSALSRNSSDADLQHMEHHTPSHVKRKLADSFGASTTALSSPMKTAPLSGSSASSVSGSTQANTNHSQRTLTELDIRMHAYLKANGVDCAEDNENYFPQFEDIKKLVLYYKQQNSLMRHEKIPLVGGDSYIQEQTQSRIDLSLYDYHIILTMLVDQRTYGPLITNLIDSHQDILKNLEYDENERIYLKPVEEEQTTTKKKSDHKPPALDPWMSSFVKYVLRNRVPLKLYVLFPDLTQALEKCFIGKRIGSAIGVKLNAAEVTDENDPPIPIVLTDDEKIVRCIKDKNSVGGYRVEFKINNQWHDITTEEYRNQSIKQKLEQNEDGTPYGSKLTKDITFTQALKQFRVRSVGWHHLDIIHDKGLQIYHKHYHVTREISNTDKNSDGSLKNLKTYNFKPFGTKYESFDSNNYLFTRTSEQAAQDAKESGAHEGDLINRDHFTSQVTSFEDIQQQYPDYDLTNLQEGQFAIFYSANREELGLSIDKTHAFLKIILPEGNNQYRVLNMGYFPDNDLANMLQIATYLGKTERGALQGDEGHFHTQRDRVGLCMLLDDAEFTKACNYLQKQFNKTRQDRLSFQPFGTNCAHRLTKIFRHTQADSFHIGLRTRLETAYAEKLKPTSFLDRCWKAFSKYVLRTTDEHRLESFKKSLRKAIDRDDTHAINAYLSDLLPRLDETNAKELFEITAQFLAKVHLNNQVKFKDLVEKSHVSEVEKYTSLLDETLAVARSDKETKPLLDPYKQLTAEHNKAFFQSVSDTMTKYEALVQKQTSKEALSKELKSLLRQFVIQGLKTSSPYSMSIYDLEGEVSWVLSPMKKYIPFEFLRNFIFAILCAFPLFGMRWRTIQRYDENGNTTGKTKVKSLAYDFMRVNRFKLPAQIFNTVRRNDEFVVTEAMLCKQMAILQEKITSLETSEEKV